MWIRGSFTVPDTPDGITQAKDMINEEVRANTDLEMFPQMKAEYQLKMLTEDVFESVEKAEEYLKEKTEAWARNYNPMIRYRAGDLVRLLVGYEEYVV